MPITDELDVNGIPTAWEHFLVCDFLKMGRRESYRSGTSVTDTALCSPETMASVQVSQTEQDEESSDSK